MILLAILVVGIALGLVILFWFAVIALGIGILLKILEWMVK